MFCTGLKKKKSGRREYLYNAFASRSMGARIRCRFSLGEGYPHFHSLLDRIYYIYRTSFNERDLRSCCCFMMVTYAWWCTSTGDIAPVTGAGGAEMMWPVRVSGSRQLVASSRDDGWRNRESPGGDPELGLRDLAALRSKTFAISSYPF